MTSLRELWDQLSLQLLLVSTLSLAVLIAA
jgi:hypothetical protein